MRWEADEDDEDEGSGKQSSLDGFVVSKSKKAEGKGRNKWNMEEMRRKKQRLDIFNELGMSKVTNFVAAV